MVPLYMRWVGSVSYARKTLILENMNGEITVGIVGIG
jgi:hypothetical protein